MKILLLGVGLQGKAALHDLAESAKSGAYRPRIPEHAVH